MKRTESMADMLDIELDRPRRIVLDVEALLAIEEALPGVNTLDLEFWKNMSTKRMRVILWASLLYEDPDLKLEDMKKVLRGVALGPITKKLLEAWGLAREKSEGGQNSKDPQNPEAPENHLDGSTSGQSLVTTSASPIENSVG